MTPDSSTSDEPGSTWLWQWDRPSGGLEKVIVPSALVPPEWVEPLQRRYVPGDRVMFVFYEDEGARLWTVVMDHGTYIALDGDAPGQHATAPKTLVQPLTAQAGVPTSPTPTPPPAAVGSPHGDPDIRTSHRCINARWNLGEPVAPGAQWQASFDVRYTSNGYRAVLRTVLEQRSPDGVSENWAHTGPPAVLDDQPARRHSAQRLREAYDAALLALRHHFAAGDPTITGYFTIPAASTLD